MDEIIFLPFPWPPSAPCACGNPAAWEMLSGEERILLCSECYQIEALKQAFSRRGLMSDRIHTTWLIYPWTNPVIVRSDAKS